MCSRNLLVTLCASGRSRCGIVRNLLSLAQPCRDFGRVGALSLWRGADFRCLVKRSYGFCGRSFLEDPTTPCIIPYRSLTGDLVEIVVRSSLRALHWFIPFLLPGHAHDESCGCALSVQLCGFALLWIS